MKTKSITIIGKRWFDKINGNTYFSAEIVINGKLVHKIPFSYGYEDSYIQAGFEWLDDNKHTKREKYDNGASEPHWRYCKDHNIALHTSASDVIRKGDLLK